MIRKVSALRAFYRFLMRRKLAERNPAAELRTPKLRRKLPTFLAVEKADETVEMPTDVGTQAQHLRDRALLEVLYGSGVRVSELVGLDLSSVDLAAGTARVLGKGGKERIVPLGQRGARGDLPSTSACARSCATRSAARRTRARCSSSARGERLGVRQVQMLVKRYGVLATGTQRAASARAAPQLRDAPARRGRRPAQHPGAARPREPVDDAALHARQHGSAAGGLRQGASAGARRKDRATSAGTGGHAHVCAL